MWFFFGFITLVVFTLGSLYVRFYSSWKGDPRTVDGVSYQIKEERNKGKLTGFLVGVDGTEGYEFSLKPESLLDLFFKKIGLSVEHQTGHREFDEEVYIASDNRDVHQLFSRDADIRKSVLKIFAAATPARAEVKRVHHRNERLWVQFKTSDEARIPALARDTAKQLARIRSVLNAYRAPQNRLRDPFVFKSILILAISSGLAINGALMLFRNHIGLFPVVPDIEALLWAAVPVAVIVLALLIFITIFLLGRTSRAHLVLTEVLLVGAFGIYSSSYAELRDLNIELDQSQPNVVQSVISQKNTHRRSKGGTDYFVTVRSPEHGLQKFEVSSCFYRSVTTGTEVTTVEHEGYLGHRWISELRGNNVVADC